MPKPNLAQVKQWAQDKLDSSKGTIDNAIAGSESINPDDLWKKLAECAVMTSLIIYMDSQLPDE